ncbi:MAG: hypothetical protein WCA46_24915 [Actinocatenispora sp.]
MGEVIAAAPGHLSPVSARRLLAGRALAGLAAGSAFVAALGTLADVAHAGPDTRLAQTWWLYGLLVFAALFVLLAVFPLRMRGLWEIVLLNKLALTVTATGYLVTGGATGSGTVAASDGALLVILLAAYLCVGGWRAGRGPTT